MFTKKSIFRMFSVLLVVLMMSGTASARPLEAALGTGFTYQGRLTDGGTPANGTYDLDFKLYDALSGGSQVGSTSAQRSVNVSNGLFTVQLDFGNVFNGTALYLEIGVRLSSIGGAYTTLTPRQPLSPTPYALYSTQASNAAQLNTQPASYYLNASNINSGNLSTNYFSAYADLVVESKIGAGSGQVAAGDHNHWGQTWSGSGTGLTLTGGTYGLISNGSTYGVFGSSPNGYGINGNSTNGTGVYGSGGTYGVYGHTYSGAGVSGNSTNGDGVDGTSTSSTGVHGTSTSGTGVYGTSTSGTGFGVSGTGYTGVYGSGSAYGLYGTGGTSGTGVAGSSTNSEGVHGSSTNGTGVYGDGYTYGVYGSTTNGVGVYGEGYRGVMGVSTDSTGVFGSSSAGKGVYGSGFDGVYGNSNTAGGAGVYGYAFGGSGDYAGLFRGNVRILGNQTVTGTKSAVVKTQDYGTRTLYAVESPEVWFEDFGTGQLTNGEAVISLDPIFAETVNLAVDYHVFLTPLGDCALYVKEKSPTSFTVRAMGGQTCSIPFDYRIVAKRLGYENVRLAEVADTQPLLPPEGGAK
jgi:hypothetical protein